MSQEKTEAGKGQKAKKGWERGRKAEAERTGGHNYMGSKKNPSKYRPKMRKVKIQGNVKGDGRREGQKEVGGKEEGNLRQRAEKCKGWHGEEG